ncbi:MAG: hypothetical protein JW870_09605 [Candidatus Delongbacteria bacterium]|nr:hypothetical protein [Candidatus Delongbacteria bacterium]
MAYKWKPNATQRREFKERMQDPILRAEHEQNKANGAAKKRSSSKFDYESASGYYLPTKIQFDASNRMLFSDVSEEQKTAANNIISAHVCGFKTHHDNIHIVNEWIRKTSN